MWMRDIRVSLSLGELQAGWTNIDWSGLCPSGNVQLTGRSDKVQQRQKRRCFPIRFAYLQNELLAVKNRLQQINNELAEIDTTYRDEERAFVELGGVFERDYTEELIILEVATVSALYPSFVRWRIF
jgi:hypothetical protein